MRPSLELSMIVKNGADGLVRCLDSVAGVVDRVVIGDTGSTDNTAAIAQRWGAEVVSLAWRHDFADARNQLLSMARCDWVLVLDADEMLDGLAAEAIRSSLDDEAGWGYDVSRWNYVRDLGFRSGGEQAILNPKVLKEAQSYPAYFRTEHTRLFRRDPRIGFRHCVHESVVDSMEAAGLIRRPANFVIHHFGYVDDAKDVRDEKDELYHTLSLRKLANARQSYEANLEAGIGELDLRKRPAAALEYLTAAVSIDPMRFAGRLYRGICLTRLARYAEALADLTRAGSLMPANALAHSAIGDVHFQTGVYFEAAKAYGFARICGDASPLTYAKLGSSEVQIGQRDLGLSKVREAAATLGASGELLDILATTAFTAGQPELACEASLKRLLSDGASGFHYVMAATIHLHAGDPSAARSILHQGKLLFPNDAEIQAMTAMWA